MSGSKTSTPDGAVVAYLADARARVDAGLQSWGMRAGGWGQGPVPAALGSSRLSTGKRARPQRVFAAAGAGGMIGGQALDLAAEGRRLPGTELEDVHRRKTGALISAACVIGAMAAGAPRATSEALRGYGADVGLAFQIYDDVLDATATSDQLGKTAGKDAADGKSTFVTLLGASAARAEAERLATRAVDRLRQAGLVSATLEGLARYIVTRPNWQCGVRDAEDGMAVRGRSRGDAAPFTPHSPFRNPPRRV